VHLLPRRLLDPCRVLAIDVRGDADAALLSEILDRDPAARVVDERGQVGMRLSQHDRVADLDFLVACGFRDLET
jgi:hypothetical protein